MYGFLGIDFVSEDSEDDGVVEDAVDNDDDVAGVENVEVDAEEVVLEVEDEEDEESYIRASGVAVPSGAGPFPLA